MAPPQAPSRVPVVLALLACAGFGGYGTLGAGFRDGMFGTITKATEAGASTAVFPGGPTPYRTSYTGVGLLDDRLVPLLAFFTFIIDGPQTWDITLSYWYLMAHFGAGMCLLLLEGTRRGNRRRAVSWTGLMGIIVQNATYTVTAPLYLVLHVLTSPVARPAADPEAVLAVDPWDLSLVPVSNILAFVVPGVMMSLPSPSVVPPLAHYAWDAVWQPFPATQNAIRGLLKRLIGNSKGSPRKTHLEVAGHAYRYVVALCVLSQLALAAVALTPPSAVPDSWRGLVTEVTLRSAFVPYWPWDTPVVDATVVGKGEGLAELARLFFQWDIYCGGTAIFVWALYVYKVARPNRSLLGLLPKVVVWGVLGGPTAAATIILWERDGVIAERKTAKVS